MTSRELFVQGLAKEIGFGSTLDGYDRASVDVIFANDEKNSVRVYLKYNEQMTQIYSPLGTYEKHLLDHPSLLNGASIGVAKIGNLLVASTSIPTPELSLQMVLDTIDLVADHTKALLENLGLQNPWPMKSAD